MAWRLEGVRIWKLSRTYSGEKPPSYSVLTHGYSLATRKPTWHLLAMPYILVRIGAPYEGRWSTLFHLPRNMAPSLNPRFLKSRNKLDEFYEEFRNVMRKYWMKLDTIKNPNALKLPWDLFKLTISVKNQTDLNNFIEFIINISERRLNFFHNHFIHEKIFMFNSTIDFNFVEQLYPYIETMKSVEVWFSNKYRFGKHEEDTICTLHDTLTFLFFLQLLK